MVDFRQKASKQLLVHVFPRISNATPFHTISSFGLDTSCTTAFSNQATWSKESNTLRKTFTNGRASLPAVTTFQLKVNISFRRVWVRQSWTLLHDYCSCAFTVLPQVFCPELEHAD